MQDETGHQYGFCWYKVERRPPGVDVSWKLRLAFPGGSYEEDRTMVLDKALQLVSASYSSGGDFCKGSVIGTRVEVLLGGSQPEKTSKTISVDVPTDALPGMDFVMASWLPLVQGAELRYSGVNESAGFKLLGPHVLEVVGRETVQIGGAGVECWKVVRRPVEGTDSPGALPLWLSDDHRILMADWGGGNFMVIADKSAEALFK